MRREQIDELWQRWLSANRDAERSGDWGLLADFYAEDASYGWMYTPDEHFMAMGREEIRRYALGTEMQGLDGWHYDYVCTVVDDRADMVVGFWRQRAGIVDDRTGEEFEIRGIGGSWFGVQEGPDGAEFAWQRDWFDLGSTATTFLAIAGSGKAPQGLLDRMSVNGKEQPGHYTYDELPSTLWPPPVERGDFITQESAP
jgi:hypothetical protein